ncbi:MAG: hypothetical protein QOE37_2186, partial [Microbacteriaceae bacterium]|nr:hypothetical protein [Microbacteriaceae bacterium]
MSPDNLNDGMPDHRAEKLKALWKLKLDFEQSCD